MTDLLEGGAETKNALPPLFRSYMAMISLHADKISKTSIHILVGKSCAKAAPGEPSLPDGANLDDVSTGAAIFRAHP